MSKMLPDWQNPDVTNIGREAPRASLIPFECEKAALSGERGRSGCCRKRPHFLSKKDENRSCLGGRDCPGAAGRIL